MFKGGSYTSVFLILLGVSLTHVVNYLIHCIILIYYFHILNCTVIFCLYYNYMGRIKIILILILKGQHAENEHWSLVEDRNGEVGYAPAAFLVVILDTTAEEQESDATKKGQENSTEENRIGQEGERRKSYSAAVIDGIKRNTTNYVGDSIIRKTDSRLSKGEDVVVCLPGARIEHVTERVEKIMGRGNGGTILIHVGTNNTDKEGTTAIVEKYRKLLKKTKQARLGQIILSGILPVCGNRIQ